MSIILYPGNYNQPSPPQTKDAGKEKDRKIKIFVVFQWNKIFYPLDDCNLQRSLNTILASPKEEERKRSVLNKFPALNELIRLTKEAEVSDRNNLAPLLFVLAGIKPALVIERFYRIPFRRIAQLMQKFPHVNLANDNKYFYIINENPLPEFDPRKFIHAFDEKYTNIKIAACWSFQNQCKSSIAVQLLSYLLGYGANWEAFNAHTHRAIPDETIFSDEHYLSLGQALEPGVPHTRTELVSLGKEYSREALERKRPNYKFDSPEFDRLHKIYSSHILAEIPYRTDYIQNSLMYKERLLEAFNIPQATSGQIFS